MLIFPVRHHSPTAALHLRQWIRRHRPRLVLVEGPADATPLIPLLLDRATVPPVAIYAYRTGEEVRAAYWPFCAYSPEYVALAAGREVGAELAFCDLPAGVSLAEAGPTEEQLSATGSTYAEYTAALAAAGGYDTFEEFWETAFEQESAADDPAQYFQVMHAFGLRARQLSAHDRDSRDTVRERHMAAAARAAMDRGIPAEQILLVCGAAHAESIAQALRTGTDAPFHGPAVDVSLVLIPYSFPRLSEQSGYGAGNRAPQFYQKVWETRGDYHTAVRQTLVAVSRRLRGEGRTASLAQTIDAYNLARTLAIMRDKPAPGADEVVEAATACFGQGYASTVAAAVKQSLIGEAVGCVTERVGKTPLQTEFYATANRMKIPILDQPRAVLVHLPVAAEAEQSVFFHRLGVAAIPFAKEVAAGLGGQGLATGALDRLGRVLEKWMVQWVPQTDAELVEKTAWGSTLTEVCQRLLLKRLGETDHIDSGAEVLLHLALCDLPQGFDEALPAVESLAADSTSFPALARAAYQLDALLSYGSARRLPVERLGALAERLFTRAALHLPAAAVCGDDGAQEVAETLVPLYELIRRHSPAARESSTLWEALATLVTVPGIHAELRGLGLVLLELGGHLTAGELGNRIRYWLSLTSDAADNARLVSGLFRLHRGTLVRNRALIAAVTDFLQDLELEQLIPFLPMLRRSLGNLSAAERAYLTETLAAVLGLAGREAAQALKLTDRETALVLEADRVVAATLVEWRERYGIA